MEHLGEFGRHAAAIPVIHDCDPGIDDALAILLALGSPEIDLRALTVVAGNAGLARTLSNALAVSGLASSATPVHAGADRPLLGRFVTEHAAYGEDGLGGVSLPDGGEPAPELAADAIRRMLRTSAEPITLVGTGPATNLALALATEPGLAANVAQIVLMAGAWGRGNATEVAEFNAFNDPEALSILVACGRPLIFATLDLTAQAIVTRARLDTLRASGRGRCLRAACDILASRLFRTMSNGVGEPVHDPCTMAWLIRPELFTSRRCAVSVDIGPGPYRGRTVIDRSGRTPAHVNAIVLETLDVDGFFALLADRLARLP